MKLLKYSFAALVAMQGYAAYAQDKKADTATTDLLLTDKQVLDDVTISANKVAEPRRNVAQQVVVLSQKAIAASQSQTTADLMSAANIFVQKSQMGGGSPVLRGFEANRVLMVIDGVRMNNIIYRAGHLQNIVTLDNASLERVEVLYGPSSNVYGSDALGGVISFYTKSPVFSSTGKLNTGVNAFVRYGSVNNEMTGHADVNLGGKKFASMTSLTYSSFGDLKGGSSQNPFYDTAYGNRLYYVERINGKDSLVSNDDKYKQVQSAYTQYDIVQKFAYKQNEHVTHGLNLQYSGSTDIPRYDRLTDPTSAGLKYAQWYYGPQQRLMAAYDLNINNDASFFQQIHGGINYQAIEESRHTRNFGSSKLSHRIEKVNVTGINVDMQHLAGKHAIRIGLDAQSNALKSTANAENINTGVSSPLDTRYPDGDNSMLNAAVYASHTWHINNKTVLTDGVRLGFISLHSTFSDTSFFHLPYTKADQRNAVYSGSLGLVHTPTDKWKLSALVSTGFRAPNVDDLSKVFESAAGSLIVPNTNLKPEKTINAEVGVTKVFGAHTVWETNLYYTWFIDAIVTDQFQYEGHDSVLYNGSMSRVLANQNMRKAYIYGLSSSVRSQLSKTLSLQAAVNYTYGRINGSTVTPLDHIPPAMVRLQLTYAKNKLGADFIVNYNGEKKLTDYFRNGEDNEQYATPEGMPAWMTANLRVSYKVQKYITLQAGVDNILDTQYRTFASGINAPGRNLFGAVRFHY